jgi:hypothetical protein
MILAGALALGLMAPAVKADEHDKKTVVKVEEPIQIVDTYLEPGTYVFKLIESSNDRHTVEIYDKDQTHLIKLMFAVPNYRVRRTGKTMFSFWETPAGTAKAVRAWFYPGDNYGQEFPYPTALKQTSGATATTAALTVPAPQPAVTETESQKSDVQTPAPEPQQQAVAQEQPQPQEPTRAPEEPVQIAQNAPAPEPQVQTPAPAPQPASDAKEPEELPRTASPYSSIGLGGLLSACMLVALRIKRMA